MHDIHKLKLKSIMVYNFLKVLLLVFMTCCVKFCDGFVMQNYNKQDNHNNYHHVEAQNTKHAISVRAVKEKGNSKYDNFQKNDVYLRFSPLVDGPEFFPIHVEVMILNYTYEYQKKVNGHLDEKESFEDISDDDDDNIIIHCLHRFDFLPANPKDKNNILQLITLQSVPGQIRHRVFINEKNASTMSNTNERPIQDNVNNVDTVYSIVPEKRIEALLGSKSKDKKKLATNNDSHNSNPYDDSLLNFVVFIKSFEEGKENNSEKQMTIIDKREEVYAYAGPMLSDLQKLIMQRNGMKLHLINNNCYTFAREVLLSLPNQ